MSFQLGPRRRLSQVLIIGSLVLLGAILVGMNMGNHVLSQVAARDPVVPTPVPIPTSKPGDQAGSALWKRIQVMAVATDPGFPDPRVTPEPYVQPTARPTPKRIPTPAPRHDPDNAYTSPPMPIPLVSHTPEGPLPDPEATGPGGAEARRTPPPPTGRPVTPYPFPSFTSP